MFELEGQKDRPGIDHNNGRSLPFGLPDRERGHPGFIDGIGPGNNDKIRFFDFPHRYGDFTVKVFHGGAGFAEFCPIEKKYWAAPVLCSAYPLEHALGLEAVSSRADRGNGLGTISLRQPAQSLSRF